MKIHNDFNENQLYTEGNFDEDALDTNEVESKKKVRKLIEERLEEKRLKEELSDEFDADFDWDDFS